MLDLLNRYAHGYVAIPVLTALARRDVLSLPPADGLGNPGSLAVAARLLESLGWAERPSPDRVALTRPDALARVPQGLAAAYDFDWAGWFAGAVPGGGVLADWLESVAARWGGGDERLADFLDGVLVLPVLSGLNRLGLLTVDAAAAGFPGLPAGAAAAVCRLFAVKGWVAGGTVTDAGRFVVERGPITGTTASYGPMLRQMDELLFGDMAAVFTRDGLGHERHLDRTLNVVASGFQHQKYFADLDETVLAIFDRLPLDRQPRAVVDMGCGDGAFLRRIWSVVERSARGRALDSHPLVLVGADFNEAALAATRRTLAGLPHRTVAGDIADPARLMRDLAGMGLGGPDDVLHVRSFLDHDRPWAAPRDRAAARARPWVGSGVDVAPDGGLIDPADAVQSLVEHLERWAGVVGRHGLLLLEVHSLPPAVVHRHMDETENLHFDAYHAFSGQHLVEAEVFALAAAEVGLFPRREVFRKYPRVFPLARIVLSQYERRPYRVRLARPDDLPALEAVETACWPEGLRADRAVLAERLARYPAGQCVLELDGRVAGVVYTQRIAAVDALRTARWDDLAVLHRDDGAVVQLLGMNVLPTAQDRGLGDEFLDFVLLWSALKSGVDAVAGLTRCRDFTGGDSAGDERDYGEYVRARAEDGRPLDPILRFHASHGAAVLGPVADYRPADTANRGHGVLIAYDLSRGRPEAGAPAIPAAADPAAAVDDCVRQVMRERARAGYARTTALRDLGLDSADLLELRALLSRRFAAAVSPTFFFTHPTAERITAALTGGAEAAAAALPVAEDDDAPPAPGAVPSTAVAVIGAGCRFPGGVRDLDGFWSLLEQGIDAVGTLPPGRWAERPDAPRHGGFLDGVDLFDGEFFGISPREARLMDPQQRLLLEVGHEALEHAALDPDRLRGSRTGVFIGVFSHDYETRILGRGDEADLDVYFATGTSSALAAGRLSYVYGLNGPAVTVNTACSSALVAVHQACRSLADGESELALAGGVNLLLSPELSVVFARAGMLSADGRCRTFDAEASGYVRGEGCGVVVLKRLDWALADGDRVLAVIRGTAVNQDGASNGITAPSGPAQEAVITDALRAAGVAAAEVGFVEAHGTGTPLGDPVEMAALAAVYGQGRPSGRPLRVGSVKTNIGHTEAAAGIAGLLKAVLAVQRGRIPGSLHFRRPNPHLRLESLSVEVPTAPIPWVEGPRLAGVSSFGFSGTNAHAIVAPPPPPAPPPAARLHPAVLTLSADSETALRQLAGRWGEWLDRHPDAAPADLRATANAGRCHRPLRAAVVGDIRGGLRALAQDAPVARVDGGGPRVAFLFTGQGSQYPGMARGLYAGQPVFRAMVDRCAAVLDREMERPLLDVLYGADGDRLSQTGATQPALFAVEMGLAALWRSWGVEPAAVLGHSVGEYAAACVAGVMSVEDGARLIAARGRLMQALPAGGAMLAVLADEGSVIAAVAPMASRLSVAAVNGPRNVVVSGDAAAVQAIAGRFSAAGVRCVPLAVSHAFHSPLMAPMLEDFRRVVETVRLSPPVLPLVSNLTGAMAAGEIATPDYWVAHVREPVRFAEGIATLDRLDIAAFLEIGPQPVLLGMGRGVLGDGRAWLASLAPGRDDDDTLGQALAALYRAGAPIDWRAVHGRRHARVALPSYPFQRRRHWIDAAPAVRRVAGEHPLAGRRLPLPGSAEVRWQARFTAATARYFDDHRLFGRIVVPAASHVSLAFAALGAEGPGPFRLTDLVFPEPLTLGDEEVRTAHLVIAPDGAGGRSLRLLTVREGDEAGPDWLCHAQGTVAPAPPLPRRADVEGVESRCPRRMDGSAFYDAFRRAGYTFGPALRWIEDVRLGENEALCRLVRPEGLDDREEAYTVYPALLDAAFQLQGVWFGADGLAGSESLFVPFSIAGLSQYRAVVPGEPLWSHVTRHTDAEHDGRSVVADVRLIDAAGGVVAEARRFQFRKVARAGLLAGLEGTRTLFVVDWPPAPLADPAGLARRLVPVAAGLVPEMAGAAGAGPLQALDDLCIRHIAAAFAAAGRPLALGAAPAALPVIPRHRRLMARLLEMLAQAGVLGADGRVARVPGPVAEAVRLPGMAAELALLDRCGPHLAGVLAGTVDPLGLLFPDGNDGALLALYRDAPAFRVLNALAADALAAVAAARGPGVRVLEVGAGTGATTAALLPVLSAGCGEYRFTDLSPRFAARARERFAGTPFLTTGVLDAEKPALGDDERGFDVIVAANVLHATRDVRVTLEGLAGRLAPGGVLFLMEAVEPRGWVDLTFGLTEGWWRFADTDRRPSHPLLSPDGWHAALAEAGFDAVSVAEVPVDAPLFRQALLIARRAAAPVAAPVVHRAGDGSALDVAAAGLAAVQAAVTAEPPRPLWLVTRGAQAVAAGDTVPHPDQAALWGIGRAALLEHPELDCRLVDLDPGADEETALAALLAAPDAERQVAVRDGIRRAARLVHRPLPVAAYTPRPDRTYLITGGLGGLGLRVARWLVERGARHLVLLGRSEPGPAQRGDLSALERAGAAVVVQRGDVADPGTVPTLLEDIAAGLPPLGGVFHAAGALDDGAILSLDRRRLARVLAAKVTGAWLLHAATAGLDLDAFVLFSSAAGVLGNAGQANHAAANAVLDALAAHRRGLGLPGLSIAWGAWAEVGTVARANPFKGLAPMAPETCLDALERLLAADLAQAAVMDMDWPALPGREAPFLSLVRPAVAAATVSVAKPAEAGGAAPASLAVHLASLPAAARRDALARRVAAEVAAVLALPADRPPEAQEGFFKLGMDSLTSLDLRTRLQTALGRSLPATLAFDHPNVAALSDHLAGLLGLGAGEPAPPPSPGPAAETPVAETPVAETMKSLSEDELMALIDGELAALGLAEDAP